MPNDDASIAQALGSICLAADTIPQHDTAKIDYGDDASPSARRTAGGSDSSSSGSGSGSGSRTSRDDDGFDKLGRALSDVGQALGELLMPRPRTHPTPTSGPVKPNTDEGFYLLATYCFDLERKMEYLYRATHAFGLHADPALARELLADETTINVAGLTWKQRAMLAEARLRELYRQVGPEHDRMLRAVAGGGAAPPG